MLGQRHENAYLQSYFYREQFHKLLRWLMVSLIIIFLLISIIIYLILFRPEPDFYANTAEGRILPMPPAKVG